MKNKIFNIGLLFIIFFYSSSCEDVLEKPMDNALNDEMMFTGNFTNSDLNKGTFIETFLNEAYDRIPSTFGAYSLGATLDIATDNAFSKYSNNETNVINLNQYNAGAISALNSAGEDFNFNFSNGTFSANTFSNIGNWTLANKMIYTINVFQSALNNPKLIFDKTSNTTDTQSDIDKRALKEIKTKNKYKGEAYFLRAWWAFQLLQVYGGKANDGFAYGVPFYKHTDEKIYNVLTGKFETVYNKPRGTYQSSINSIIQDLDSAVRFLPPTYPFSDADVSYTAETNVGRASATIANAFKTRVLLYSASPAFQDDNIVKINGINDFSVQNKSVYENKWKEVALEMSSVLSKIGGVATPGLKATDFNTTPASSPEIIFRNIITNRSMETQNFPPVLWGNAVNQPSQNLVNAFPTISGYPISHPSSNFNAQNPYVGRDNRLANTVYVNGQKAGDGKSVFPLQTYINGADAFPSHANATSTGYYLRKWLSHKDNLTRLGSESEDNHVTPLLRKTEVLLNYAEALNEAFGPNDKSSASHSAFEIIRIIRNNAGIPAADPYLNEVAALGKDAFRKLIQNERRIELAFENQRFFDLRRCLLNIGEDIKGVSITKTGIDEKTKKDILVFAEKTVASRKMIANAKYYYYPLPQSEIAKNPKIVNNIGW